MAAIPLSGSASLSSLSLTKSHLRTPSLTPSSSISSSLLFVHPLKSHRCCISTNPRLHQRRREILRAAVSEATIDQTSFTMFFQAEGAMNEAAILTVTKALEEVEGISSLKVQLVESIASVELTKETTMQATEAASSLVEIILGSGFTLRTLNLSFELENEEVINEVSF